MPLLYRMRHRPRKYFQRTVTGPLVKSFIVRVPPNSVPYLRQVEHDREEPEVLEGDGHEVRLPGAEVPRQVHRTQDAAVHRNLQGWHPDSDEKGKHAESAWHLSTT